jgi:hypothetical protein
MVLNITDLEVTDRRGEELCLLLAQAKLTAATNKAHIKRHEEEEGSEVWQKALRMWCQDIRIFSPTLSFQNNMYEVIRGDKGLRK